MITGKTATLHHSCRISAGVHAEKMCCRASEGQVDASPEVASIMFACWAHVQSRVVLMPLWPIIVHGYLRCRCKCRCSTAGGQLNLFIVLAHMRFGCFDAHDHHT